MVTTHYVFSFLLAFNAVMLWCVHVCHLVVLVVKNNL